MLLGELGGGGEAKQELQFSRGGWLPSEPRGERWSVRPQGSPAWDKGARLSFPTATTEQSPVTLWPRWGPGRAKQLQEVKGSLPRRAAGVDLENTLKGLSCTKMEKGIRGDLGRALTL